ncbi:hypothetical protein B0H10DRAFT_1958542 [Mycena sp. CBHHK59/15]|nr:hypothetical protein B0H10DRAFT_1958542 [Mycena sp. CBHHK59/15]
MKGVFERALKVTSGTALSLQAKNQKRSSDNSTLSSSRPTKMNKPNNEGNDIEMNDEGLDVFYEGDKQHSPVVHGWIQRISRTIIARNTTMLAVIITSDRTTREGGADAISDALESHGWISTGDKTRVLTPTPAVGSSGNVAIHPFTNVIAD